MSLEIEWPRTWDMAFVAFLKGELQSMIREAMTKHPSSQMRGKCVVEDLNLGSTAPELTITHIREISPQRTHFDVHVWYKGDASVTIKGLQLNLDGCAAEGQDVDDVLCPFAMTLCSLQIVGTMSLELTNIAAPAEPKFRPTLPFSTQKHVAAISRQPQRLSAATIAENQKHISEGRAPSVASTSSMRKLLRHTHPSGIGAIIASGGKRDMRAPLEAPEAETDRSGASGGDGLAFFDLVNGTAVRKGGKLKIQFYVDPLKDFSVVSNFGDLPKANEKIKATLKILLQPVMQKLQAEGFTIPL